MALDVDEISSPSSVDGRNTTHNVETGWECWRLILEQSDLVELTILAMAPIVFVVTLSPCDDTSSSNQHGPSSTSQNPSCFSMHGVAILFAFFFITTFLYRSNKKYTTAKYRRSFGFFCFHTGMETCKFWTIEFAYAMSEVYFNRQSLPDYQPSIMDFAVVFLQIWLSTAVSFVCFNRMGLVSAQIQNNVIRHCCETAFVALILSSVILAVDGIFRLVHCALNYNPWTIPCCLALACAGVFMIIRCLIRWCR